MEVTLAIPLRAGRSPHPQHIVEALGPPRWFPGREANLGCITAMEPIAQNAVLSSDGQRTMTPGDTLSL
jgi:hypothetical protein